MAALACPGLASATNSGKNASTPAITLYEDRAITVQASPQDNAAAAGWRARIELGLARSGARTVARHRVHRGPLYVQRALYPEADGCCHLYLLHPPGGLVQGDRIDIDVRAERDARVLLTTPSAAKLYRTPAGGTHQQATIRVADGASVEYLPQEAIVYDGATGHMRLDFHLEPEARLIAWDAVALGRPAANEAFVHGLYDNRLAVHIGGRLHWHERTRMPGTAQSAFQQARWGMDGHGVLGTLVAYAPQGIDEALTRRVRDALDAVDTPTGVTCVDGLLIVRVLAANTMRLHDAMQASWRALRPTVLGKAAVAPRIWAT